MFTQLRKSRDCKRVVVNLKTIDQYQHICPRVMARYTTGKLKSFYFRGGSHIHYNLIKCEDNSLIH